MFVLLYIYIHVARYKISSTSFVPREKYGVTGDPQFLGGINFPFLASAPAKLYQQHGELSSCCMPTLYKLENSNIIVI